ncbi:hypothetical protein [Nostoc sp. FACHB-110]|nr:hypothetical protein [Nostoc sp. FACHB-110]
MGGLKVAATSLLCRCFLTSVKTGHFLLVSLERLTVNKSINSGDRY